MQIDKPEKQHDDREIALFGCYRDGNWVGNAAGAGECAKTRFVAD